MNFRRVRINSVPTLAPHPGEPVRKKSLGTMADTDPNVISMVQVATQPPPDDDDEPKKSANNGENKKTKQTGTHALNDTLNTLQTKIHLPKLQLDLDQFVNIFNSYATKKTLATGFFNLALVSTNFAQMKQLIVSDKQPHWTPLNIICLSFVCLSLFLQFVVAVALVFMAKSGEFIDETKRNTLIRSNNFTTLLVLAITIINIFINIFISI